MSAEEVLIPLAGMALVAVMLGLITGVIGQWISNRTLREALRSNPEQARMIINRMGKQRRLNSDGIGLVAMAGGAALAVAALIGPAADRVAVLQVAVLPGFIGAAVFALRWLSPRRQGAAPELTAE